MNLDCSMYVHTHTCTNTHTYIYIYIHMRIHIFQIFKRKALAELRRAIILVGLSVVVFSCSWALWRRRRARARLHRAIINDIRTGVHQPEPRQRHAIAASPTLRSCCVCHTRARDCVLLDCHHQGRRKSMCMCVCVYACVCVCVCVFVCVCVVVHGIVILKRQRTSRCAVYND